MKTTLILSGLALALLLSSSVQAQDKPSPLYADVFGMTIQQLTPQAAQLLGLSGGVQIVAVEPDSEAARAGIVRNDVVTAVGKTPITTVTALFNGLEKSPGALTIRIQGATGPKRLQIPRPKIAGRIAFQSQRTGKGDIYSINADGTGLLRLTSEPEAEGNPVWSPDGRKIVYNGAAPNVHYNSELWAMNADGTGTKRLSDNVFAKELPRWSPDGKYLYYLSDRNNKWDLWRSDASGANPVSLAECSPRLDVMAWTYPVLDVSPDGSLVAFPRLKDGAFAIALLHASSGSILPLSAQVPNPLRPDWNKAGNKVIVSSNERFYTVDMKTNTATPLNLTRFDPPNIASIMWSPRGDFFIVTARPSPNEKLQLYLVSADGSLRRRLTFSTFDDNNADWTDAPVATSTKAVARK